MGKKQDEIPAVRASRGKRMAALIQDDQEADDDFWNQAAFKEDDQDDEYEEEGGGDDEFDSDFDLDEPDDDEEEGEEEERPGRARPKKLPPGSTAGKKKKVLRKGEVAKKKTTKVKSLRDAGVAMERAAAAADKGPGAEDGEEEEEEEETGSAKKRGRPRKGQREARVMGIMGVQGEEEGLLLPEQLRRKSTRTVVVEKDREREQAIAYKAATASKVPKKKKRVEEERRLTQEEMLQEAAQTEIQNIQRLEIVLAREEEVKRRAVIEKEVFSGPQIRYHSKGGETVMEFLKFTSLPETIKARSPPYPKRVTCVVTGLPAKYRDPKTGLPYATIEAFKIIRKRSGKAHGNINKGLREQPLSRDGGRGEAQAGGPRTLPLLPSGNKAKPSKRLVGQGSSLPASGLDVGSRGGKRFGPTAAAVAELRGGSDELAAAGPLREGRERSIPRSSSQQAFDGRQDGGWLKNSAGSGDALAEREGGGSLAVPTSRLQTTQSGFPMQEHPADDRGLLRSHPPGIGGEEPAAMAGWGP